MSIRFGVCLKVNDTSFVVPYLMQELLAAVGPAEVHNEVYVKKNTARTPGSGK